jgi:hypothetical protein
MSIRIYVYTSLDDLQSAWQIMNLRVWDCDTTQTSSLIESCRQFPRFEENPGSSSQQH